MAHFKKNHAQDVISGQRLIIFDVVIFASFEIIEAKIIAANSRSKCFQKCLLLRKIDL